MGSGEGECVFDGALDLGEERGGQTSQPSDDSLLIDSLDLLSDDFGRKREASRPFWND
jgi:hypothetical protein